MIGLNDPDNFSGHALWVFYITKLYNSPVVSNIEAMAAAQHNSVTASTCYMQRDTVR